MSHFFKRLLIIFAACLITGCSTYRVEDSFSRTAVLRKASTKKYRFEIELIDHVVYYGNPRWETHEITKQDETLWLYLNNDRGEVDLAHVAVSWIRNSEFSEPQMEGVIRLRENEMDISVLPKVYRSDRGDRTFDAAKLLNGTYSLHRER